MLTKMRLEYFKSWRKLELDLSNLTFLFGTNSSGKTSILQALLLLKQTAMGFDRNLAMNLGGAEQDYVDFGSYRDLVFRHEDKETIGINLAWRTDPSELAATDRATDVQYSVNWTFLNTAAVVVARLLYDLTYANHQSTVIDAWYSGIQKYALVRHQHVGLAMKRDLQVWLKSCYELVPNVLSLTELENEDLILFDDLAAASIAFEELVNSIAYLGPLRSHPQRAYPFRGAEPTDIGPRGEKTIEWLLSAARKDDNRVQQVADWLSRLGLASEFRIDAIDPDKRFYEPRIKIKPGEVENTLLDVGFGVSQVLPIVTLLFAAPERSIVLIEQPELHLHPLAQANLADLFLEVAEKRKLQLIIESHSEHILARVQRRIAEQANSLSTPEHIRMYFCDIETGESKAEPVKLNRFGQVENWPKDFFGDISGDLDAMMEAGLARRRKELAQQKE